MFQTPTSKPLNVDIQKAAIERQNSLTKPPGSLGQLEAVVIMLAAQQGNVCPHVNHPHISVFAADHGVAEEGVSAFPAVVTQEMVKNFSAGGAAITVLAKANHANFEVVDVGVLNDVGPLPNLVSQRVASGSFNFAKQRAMTEQMCSDAMQVGRDAVLRAQKNGCDLFVGGEMGIANTSSATAIITQLTAIDLPHSAMGYKDLVGYGTGINDEQKIHKADVIAKALEKHADYMQTPIQVLEAVGGLEIAALTGAYLTCAELGISVAVDGVIACSAALVACEMLPETKNWMLFAHESVEPAQQAVFEKLGVTPLLNLEMRLGEGSGAAMAIPVMRMACELHANMATFTEAGVSDAN